MTSSVPGAFCIVLHSHLPWLPGHGVWPLGEEWLFQAWAESYVPPVAELDALQTRVDAVRALQAETTAELNAMLPAILDKAFKREL